MDILSLLSVLWQWVSPGAASMEMGETAIISPNKSLYFSRFRRVIALDTRGTWKISAGNSALFHPTVCRGPVALPG